MLKTIQNYHSTTREELLAEVQAGFKPNRNTIKYVISCSILTEYLQHQQGLFNNSIDFKEIWD